MAVDSIVASISSLSHVVGGAVSHTVGEAAHVTGGGLAALTSAAPSLPQLAQVGAHGSQQLATGVGMVERPAKALAGAVPDHAGANRVAAFLGRALPLLAIGSGALAGAQVVASAGTGALITRRDGRAAVLSTLGGALLLAPAPPAQLAAAGVLGIAAVNHFGGLRALDR